MVNPGLSASPRASIVQVGSGVPPQVPMRVDAASRPKDVVLRFIIATAFITVPMGSLLCWGRLERIVRAHLEYKHGPDAVPSTNPIIVFAWISFSLSMFVYGKLIEISRYPRLIVLVSAAIGGLAYMLASLATNVTATTLCFVMLGFAQGVYIVPLYYVVHCFRHSLGIMTGYVAACFAAGELVHNYYIGYLLNLDELPRDTEEHPSDDTFKKVSWMLRVMSFCFLGAVALGSVILPEPRALLPTAQEEPDTQPLNSPYAQIRGQLFRKWYFWLLPLMIFGNFVSGRLVVLNYIEIGVSLCNFTRSTACSVADWAVTTSLASCLLWGVVTDAFGVLFTLMVVTVSCGSTFLPYAFIHNAGLYHLWTCFVFTAWNGNHVLFPILVVYLFGRRNFTLTFPIANLGVGFGHAIAILLGSSFRDSLKHGEVPVVLVAFVIGTLNFLIYPVKYFWGLDEHRVREKLHRNDVTVQDGTDSKVTSLRSLCNSDGNTGTNSGTLTDQSRMGRDPIDSMQRRFSTLPH